VKALGKASSKRGKQTSASLFLSADLTESTQAHHFEKEFPDRTIQVGVAEQNLATVAAGMANYGKIPFFTSYATFSPGRNWEQIRTTIAFNDVPAICCGMHAGILTGPDGATHEALEDLGDDARTTKHDSHITVRCRRRSQSSTCRSEIRQSPRTCDLRAKKLPFLLPQRRRLK
jgi:transketolase C-terminal domain/subunit